MTILKRVLAVSAILGLVPLAAAAQGGPQMTVTPSNGYYSSGPQGGPFNPGVQLFQMKNNGATAISYTVSADQTWVSVFMTSGNMNPGETWTNPVFVATAANSLTPGTHTATITFTNTTNGSGNTTRTVTLIVGSAGDAVAPTVTITNPVPPNATSPTPSVTVSGTASDNTAVTSMYWVNMLTNESGTMPGAANWMFSVGLVNGDNLIHVLAWDGSGNQGTASITVHYGPVTGSLMAVSPATGFTSTGPSGGPFSPLQQVYTVSNTGTASMDFTATGTQPWLNVFSGSGTVAAGGTQNVILSFTAAANSLAAGTYSDTVTFTNTTNGAGNTTRTVSLVIGSSSDTTPPSITIVNPAPPSATASLGPITISGTASDNVGVTAISWQNAEALQSGSVAGGTSWSVSVPLVSGTNTITVTARDAGGNSASATIVVTMGLATSGPTPTSGGGGKSHHCVGAVSEVQAPLWTLLLAALVLGLSFRRQGT